MFGGYPPSCLNLPRGTDAPLEQDAADPRVATTSAPVLEPGQASAATSAWLQVPLAAVPSEFSFYALLFLFQNCPKK